MLTEMPNEGMFVLVTLEGPGQVSGDDTGRMHDPSGGLGPKAELGVRRELGWNNVRDRPKHMLTKGVEVV